MKFPFRNLTILGAISLGALTACNQADSFGEAELPLDGAVPLDRAGAELADGDAPVDPEGEAGPKRHRRGHHEMGRHKRGGPHVMLMRAIGDLDLSDAQRTALDELKRDIRSEMKDARGGRGEHGAEMRKALSDGVLSGDLDVADFQDELDAVEAKAAERTAAMLSHLADVREILTDEQRTELVATLKEKREAREARRAERKEKRAAKKGEMKGKRAAKRAERMGLSADQIAQLDKARAAAGLDTRPERPDHEHMSAVMEAFASHSFDVKALAARSPMPGHVRAKAERKIKELAVLVPILDESQRTALSSKIAEGRKHGRKGRFGRKGRRGDGRRGGPAEGRGAPLGL